jgi:iron complex transport system substrate-binding protein
MKRIASLLPSATDIVGALGLESWLVGVSHECDWPPSVKSLPRLTRSLVESELPPAQVESLVNQSIHRHSSLYDLDADLMRQLKPDVILTQELCDVCAVSYDQVLGAARLLRQDGDDPAILSLEPSTLSDVMQTVEVVADQLGVGERGRKVVDELKRAAGDLRHRGAGLTTRKSVLVIEWPDPPWIGGHWVPEMISIAGARTVAIQQARSGVPSIRASWEEILASDPDLIVLAPCGYDRARAAQAIADLDAHPEWRSLRAVQNGQVYPVDANSFWSRPGPRLLEGIAELQQILGREAP